MNNVKTINEEEFDTTKSSDLQPIRTNMDNYYHTQLFDILWPLVAHDDLICKNKHNTLRPYSQDDINLAIKAYEEHTLETTKICFKSRTKSFTQTVSHIGIIANQNGYVSVLPFDFDNKQKTSERRKEIENILEQLKKQLNATPIVFNSAGGHGLHAFFILDRPYTLEEIDRYKDTLPFKTKNGDIELKINTGIFLPKIPNGECDKYISGLESSSIYSLATLSIPNLHAIRSNILSSKADSSNYFHSLGEQEKSNSKKRKWITHRVTNGTRKECWLKWCQEYHYNDYALEEALIETEKRMLDNNYHDLDNPSKDWTKNKAKCLADMKDFYLNLKVKIANGTYSIDRTHKTKRTTKKEVANEWFGPLVKIYECNEPLSKQQKQWALKASKQLLGNKYYDKNGYNYEITKEDIDNLINNVLPALNGIYKLGYEICSIPHQAWAKLGNPVFIKRMLIDMGLINTEREYKRGDYCTGYKINKIPEKNKKAGQDEKEQRIVVRRESENVRRQAEKKRGKGQEEGITTEGGARTESIVCETESGTGSTIATADRRKIEAERLFDSRLLLDFSQKTIDTPTVCPSDKNITTTPDTTSWTHDVFKLFGL